MKPKTYKGLGAVMFAIGLLVLIYFLLGGLLKQAIYSTFNVGGDYWLWGYLIIPTVFVLIGSYYYKVGKKGKEVSTLINWSAFINLTALTIGLASIILTFICSLSGNPWCGITILILGIPVVILLIIGILLLAMSGFKK